MNTSYALLKEDKRVIAYRPRLSRMIGTTAAILLQQIIYWYEDDPFYKFKAPCQHPKYKHGDSWVEELGFSINEFDNALKRIGTKSTQGTDKSELMTYDGDIPTPLATETKRQYTKRLRKVIAHLVIYWTDSDRVTRYHLNTKLLAKLINSIYLDKLDISIYLENGETPFTFLQKTTQETTTEKKNIPPTSDGNAAIEFNTSTHSNTLQDYIDGKQCPDCNELIHDGTCLCDGNLEDERNMPIGTHHCGGDCTCADTPPRDSSKYRTCGKCKSFVYDGEACKCEQVIKTANLDVKPTMAEVDAAIYGTRDNPVIPDDSIGEVVAPDEPPPPAAKTKKQRKPTAHTLMKNALVDAMGYTQDDITCWGDYNNASKKLRNANPPVKPGEVKTLHEFSTRLARQGKYTFKSPMQLAKDLPEYRKHQRKQEQLQAQQDDEQKPLDASQIIRYGEDYE